jgi:beta-glucosidase
VQLYVSALASSVFRPTMELQGFQKVNDLKPGETRKVLFTIDIHVVSYWDEKKDKWCVEAGKYRVSIRASVEDLRLATFILVSSTFHWTDL